MIYKNNANAETIKKFESRETVESFLARGGEITKLAKKTEPVKRAKSYKKKGIDAQALLDAAMGTKDEAGVIAFLKSQGIEVE